MNDKGPVVFEGIRKAPINPYSRPVTYNDFALIDELSGLNDFLENHMRSVAMSETQKARIRAYMHTYSGPKPKEQALNEISLVLYGDTR